MSRKARIKDDYGIFYIYQQSGNDRYMFECDRDREQFLTILARTQKKFQFKLYAFCILSQYEYHLVMDVNGGDLSSIMKSINITYAMYTKCNGKLFKDRYKSQLLNSNAEIIEVISKINNNYHNHSLQNSYCSFNGSMPLNIEKFQTSDGTFTTDCTDCIHSITEAKEKLNTIAKNKNKMLSELMNDKVFRNQLIQDFRKHSTLSLKDLGIVFGGLSESTICKILNS